MVGGIDPGVYLGDLTVGTNDKRVAGRELHESEVGQRAVGSGQLVVRVCEQSEVQAFFRAELLVGIHVVGTHAKNDRVTLGVLWLIHLKLVGFPRSTRRLVFRIEVQDDPFPTVVLEADEGSILRGKSEVGSFAAH